jgi:hypothetical protein
MNSSEAMIHSFIVKIWIEEVIDDNGEVIWRGHITHVPSNERRYITYLSDISTFISIYLEAMGVKIGQDTDSG